MIDDEFGEHLPQATIVELRRAYFDEDGRDGVVVLTPARTERILSRYESLRRTLKRGATVSIPLIGRLHLPGK